MENVCSEACNIEFRLQDNYCVYLTESSRMQYTLKRQKFVVEQLLQQHATTMHGIIKDITKNPMSHSWDRITLPFP